MRLAYCTRDVFSHSGQARNVWERRAVAEKQWAAAERRYRLAIEEFGESPLIPRAKFRRGLCLWELGLAETDPAEQERLQQDALELIRRVAGAEADTRLGKNAQRFLDTNAALVTPESQEAEPAQGG